MIKFTLACDKGHDFEGWFGSTQDFAAQQGKGLVACPYCDSVKVEKALMAPSVSTSKTKEKIKVANTNSTRKALFAEIKELRDKITANAEDVGEKFPEEARKIHYGEAEERGIYGAASKEDVKELVEEGVKITPLPVLPDDVN